MTGFGKRCVPFPFGVLGRVWNLIVSAPDHLLLFYLIWLGRVDRVGIFT